jgi:hypothetical protein
LLGLQQPQVYIAGEKGLSNSGSQEAVDTAATASPLPLLLLLPLTSLLLLLLLAGTRHTVKPQSPTTSNASLKKGLKASAATRPVCPAISCTVLCAHSTLPCSSWQAGGAPQAGE